jgi:hypothetical protein
MKEKPVLEKVVKQKVQKELRKQYPACWVYMPVQTGYGQHGIPDFIACIPTKITQDMIGKTIGVFAGIETKREGGKVSAYQKIQLKGIEDAGGIARVITGIHDNFHAGFQFIKSFLGQ